MRWEPRKYQVEPIDFLLDRWLEGHRGAAYFADPGLGKTGVMLTAFQYMQALGEMQRMLVIAPLRTIQTPMSTWQQHLRDYDNFRFRSVKVHGTPRKKRRALGANAEIYLTNHDSVKFLRNEKHLPKWDLIAVDESTAFKDPTTQRWRGLKNLIRRMNPRVAILSGTPAANSYGDLYAQAHILDDGEALGVNQTIFRARFMQQENRGGFNRWVIRDSAKPTIERLMAPMSYRQDIHDHLDMPERIDSVVWVDLPPGIQRVYDDMERQMFADISAATTVLAESGGSKYAMCRGIANGGVYENFDDGSRRMHLVHNEKTKAVAERVEELAGKPVLVPYLFWHDLDRLKQRFPNAPAINGETKPSEFNRIMIDWQRGDIPVLFCQPQAMSHGVDGLQKAGNDIVWCGIPDKPEVLEQTIRRIFRSGVQGQVRVHYVLARNTVDVPVWNMAQQKARAQEGFLQALKAYREQKLSGKNPVELAGA